MNPKVKMIDRLIRDQVKLFPDFFHDDDGLREVITQIVTGKPGRRMAKLYKCLVESFIMVGGSDQSNQGYYDRQKVKPTYYGIQKAIRNAACPKLASFEAYQDCGYRKMAKTCNNPDLIASCPVPHLDMKRGGLTQMAFSLFFFLRDVCRGDFYRFVKDQFGDGNLPEGELTDRIQGFIDQLSRIHNVGPKLVDMVFSHIFFTQAPGWDYQAIGVRMVAIDTLVHNFMAKTGTLDSYGQPHKYGPKCHSQAGCVGVIEEIAKDLDCRKYHPSYPAYFPRLIQVYIWAYCAMNGENICNGNKCKVGKPNMACTLLQEGYCRPFDLPQSAPSEGASMVS